MKTHRYVFARTFVNLAIIFAAFAFLSGVGVGLLRLAEMNSKIAAAAYRPTGDLLESMSAAKASLAGTRQRVLYSLGLNSFPGEIPMSSLSIGENPFSGVSPDGVPGVARGLADQALTEVGAIKAFHAQQFRESIRRLRSALLDDAQNMAGAHPPAAQATPVPSAPATTIQNIAVPARFRVFEDPIREDKERFEDIQIMRVLLNRLAENSQQQENLRAIAGAQKYLEKAMALLDSDNRPATLPQAIQQQSPAPPSPPEAVAKAEIIAGKLGEAEAVLGESLYTRWRVDADIARLRRQAESDASLARQLEETRRGLFQEGVRNSLITFVIAAATAFLVLVVADLIRAFLNLSNNTDTLAVASVEREKSGP